MTPKLRSIAAEAKACRAAWAAAPKARYAFHLHHELLLEELTEPAANRIAYILRDKPKGEQALRLRLFRPASTKAWKASAPARAAYDTAIASAGAAYDKASAPARAAYDTAIAAARAAYSKAIASAGAAYDKASAAARAAYGKAIAAAHLAECPDCPWDGTSIFGGGA